MRMLPALFDLACCLPPFAPLRFCGIAGTGGASWAGKTEIEAGLLPPPWLLTALPLLPGRAGLGLRKVRSVMLPWLPLLFSSLLGLLVLMTPPRDSTVAAVPLDETEPFRRRFRLVCTSATLVGVAGRALRAAAAAAEESDRFGLLVRLKTARAAVAAFGFAVAVVRGCVCCPLDDAR
jgi:hypothetical protein